MAFLELEKLERTEAQRRPFEYIAVPEFVSGANLSAVNRDFPNLQSAGNFPIEDLEYGSSFAAFIEEIRGADFRLVTERKFNISLAGLSPRITVRKFAEQSDGNIHTDIRAKVLTGLIYLNENWKSSDGRLRLLRNAYDIEDYVAEIPPVRGALLMFKRSDNSWHGHKPFVGERRTIQINWTDVAGRKGLLRRAIGRLRRIAKR